MSTVYVLVAHRDGALTEATPELVAAARPLGDIAAVVVGALGTAQALAPELGQLGVGRIIAAESADAEQRLILPAVDALQSVATAQPGPIVLAAGEPGNEIGARAAARLASGVLCDVVGIAADRTASQSIFGDTVAVTAAVGGASPVYTVRAGAVAPEKETAATSPQVEAIALPGASAKDVTITGFTPAEQGGRPDLTTAKVVVAGGRGLESAEGFAQYAEQLADALGGAVGATRDAVDLGYYNGKYQIGQTGVTVSPDLYFGLGLSGAIQHKSGMQTSGTIIAVNNDEDAPIFEIADLGVVGDVAEVVPQLVEEIQKRR